MGRSVSATLAFGVDLGYDAPFNTGTEDDPDTDLGEYLALRSGAKDPYKELVPPEVYGGPYDAFKYWMAEHPEVDKATDDWYGLKRRLEAEAPVEVDFYGTAYGESYYVLILKDSKVEADWSEATKLDLSDRIVRLETIQKAKAWCAENGLPSFEDAAWILYAMEG